MTTRNTTHGRIGNGRTACLLVLGLVLLACGPLPDDSTPTASFLPTG